MGDTTILLLIVAAFFLLAFVNLILILCSARKAFRRAAAKLATMCEALGNGLAKLENRGRLDLENGAKLQRLRQILSSLVDCLKTPNRHTLDWTAVLAPLVAQPFDELMTHFGELPMRHVVDLAIQDVASTLECLKHLAALDGGKLEAAEAALERARALAGEQQYEQAIQVAQSVKVQLFEKDAS